MITLTPFIQGKLTVVAGPVRSGKTKRLEGLLDSATDSGLRTDSNIIVVKHPLDDNGAERIGKHLSVVTDDPDAIADLIRPTTRTLIIAGAAHYETPQIVELVDAVVRSNRDVFVTALNLDSNGRPYRHLAEIMALADDVIVEKAICSRVSCGDPATRSKLVAESTFEPMCTHHFHFDGSPPIPGGSAGYLELSLGPMFSSKSLNWGESMSRVKRAGHEYVAFKWLRDTRGNEGVTLNPFDTGYVELKSGEKIPALLVRDANDITDYLRRNPRTKAVFVDELQFISGIYDVVFKLMPEGYKFYGTGLPRPFKRTRFGEVSALMCLADKINMQYAYCVICHHPATENQRMKRDETIVRPANFDDPLVAVGGGESGSVSYFYQARCLRHFELPGEPELRYKFPVY